MSLEYSLRFVDQHRGPYAEFLSRYQSAVADAQSAGRRAYAEFCGDLVDYCSDERSLKCALDHLLRYGGTAPGPDGEVLLDLCRMGRWSLVRELRDRIRGGCYERGPLRRCRIRKRPWSDSMRTIWVANIEDRIVARGAAQILVPILDQRIAPLSFCWPGRGRTAALACAVEEVVKNGRTIWITEDLRDAFDQVPRGRLMQILRHYVPCDGFCRLVEQLAARPTRRGILQGSALSPALLDIYLSHTLHRGWQREVNLPLLRYVDDLLVGCAPAEDYLAVYRELVRWIQAAGMQPKLGAEKAISDLRAQSVTWLGYRLRLLGERLVIRSAFFAPASRERMQQKHQLLVGKFAQLHSRPIGWRNANPLVLGIVADLAPTLPYEDPQRIYQLISHAAAEAGFSEISSFDEVLEHWKAAYQRWLLRLNIPGFDNSGSQLTAHAS